MRYIIKTSDNSQSARAIVESMSSGTKSPEELLDALGKYGIDWYVTKEGTLMIRYWQVGAAGFLSPEKAGTIRSYRPSPEHSDQLDWLSMNLQNIRKDYAGQWIALYGNRIVAAALNLPLLMSQITEFDGPFITFIPAEPIVWTFTYAS